MRRLVRTPAEQVVLLASSTAHLLLVGWTYLELWVGWRVILAWVYDHETLSTGVLAVGSAVIGAVVLQNQTAQAARFESRKTAALREAARLDLPLALSAISAYAEQAAKATRTLLDQCVGEDLPPRAQLQLPDEPQLPTAAVVTLKDVAESADPDEVRPLAILVADIQVQASRLHSSIARAGHEETLVVKANLEEYIIDCALIYSRAGSLFAYARGTTPYISGEVRWHDLYGALFHFDMLGQQYERIRETIKRRSGGDEWSIVNDRWSARGG